jgi:hypothetical protein
VCLADRLFSRKNTSSKGNGLFRIAQSSNWRGDCVESYRFLRGYLEFDQIPTILRMTLPFPTTLAADGIPQSRFSLEWLAYRRAGKPVCQNHWTRSGSVS